MLHEVSLDFLLSHREPIAALFVVAAVVPKFPTMPPSSKIAGHCMPACTAPDRTTQRQIRPVADMTFRTVRSSVVSDDLNGVENFLGHNRSKISARFQRPLFHVYPAGVNRSSQHF